MKTTRILLIALLLAGSTTLMAATRSRSFGESKTELTVKSLDLSKKQAKKLAAIHRKYAKKDALLFAQSRSLQQLGYMDKEVHFTFVATLNKHKDAKMDEIKSILSEQQWVAFESSMPSQPSFKDFSRGRSRS